MQTQCKSNKQSSNEHPAGCQRKLARDTRKQTKQSRASQLPANLKASRRPATRSTQQPKAQNQKHETNSQTSKQKQTAQGKQGAEKQSRRDTTA